MTCGIVFPDHYPFGVRFCGKFRSMFNSQAPLTVVLVDDDEATRRALRRALSRPGVNVTEFPSAEDTLTYLTTSPIDVLITDYDLPGLNGVALIAAARAAGHRGHDVLISGRHPADCHARLAEERLAGVEVLSKPLPFERLHQLVVDRRAHRR